MKITEIKISNVLSFKYHEDISTCGKIEFSKQTKEDLHILIGPNGSGKSNFLEIINQLFQNTLFKRCDFKKTKYINRKSDRQFEKTKKEVLTPEQQNVIYLNKNWDFTDKEQKIDVSVSLNKNDKENIDFVIKNAKKIDEYFANYSNQNPNFSTLIGNDINRFKRETSLETVEFYFSRKNDNEPFKIEIAEQDNAKKFIKLCFEYFEFLQSIIEIHNLENSRGKWPLLKNTFALIGCYRNYNSVNPVYQASNPNESDVFKNAKNQQKQESTKQSNNNEPAVFGLVKHKFSYEGVSLISKHGKTTGLNKLKKSKVYMNINNLLEKFLGLKLKIGVETHEWKFTFEIEKNNKVINFQHLSAGQKGLIHLIFSLYGYDIENGLIIIDEPELHLHPQLQKKYLEIIEQESKKRDIQFIIATHSPVFVSERTIKNIQRFYFDENRQSTKVISPQITEQDEFLVKVLNYTNAAKIFFADKAILVEGEQDEYFFNFYLEYFRLNESGEENIDNYEIFNIGGKGSHEDWRKFLKKWALQVFFICDWDNVKTMGLVDTAWKTKIQNNRTGGSKKPYSDIIQLLKNEDSGKYSSLTAKINNKRKQKIFILKNGELEDYLGERTKLKLQKVITFCAPFDPSKLNDKREIDGIVKSIFKK